MDVLGRSRYGVSLPPALRALHLGVDRDPELMSSLVESVRRHGSATAARRVGLLIDHDFGSEAAAPFYEMIGNSRTAVLLRSSGSPKGDIDCTWPLTGRERHHRTGGNGT